MSAAHTLTLSNGQHVPCRIEYAAMGMWTAFEEGYDLGRPYGQGNCPDAALNDLRVELESELP